MEVGSLTSRARVGLQWARGDVVSISRGAQSLSLFGVVSVPPSLCEPATAAAGILGQFLLH